MSRFQDELMQRALRDMNSFQNSHAHRASMVYHDRRQNNPAYQAAMEDVKRRQRDPSYRALMENIDRIYSDPGYRALLRFENNQINISMEKYCARLAGTFCFNRPIYSEDTSRPPRGWIIE